MLPVKIYSLLLIFLLSAAVAQTEEKDAAKILEKSLEAMGGIEKLEAIQTKSATAKVSVAGLKGTYAVTAKAPNKLKTVLDLNVLKQERGFDGENGWQKQNTLQPLTGDDLERLKRSAVFNPLLDYYKTKTPAVLAGKETVENQECYRIEFKPSGSQEIYYINTTNFLPLREQREVTIDNQVQQLQINYSDYRKVDEVMLPFSIVQILPGQTLAVKIDSYKLNGAIDDSVFKNPADAHQDKPYEVTLSTIPQNVYKENDGVWEAAPTDSWIFFVIVQEKYGRTIEPVAAKIEFYSEEELLETHELSEESLEAIRGISFGGFNNLDESFDLRHHFSKPSAAAIDKMIYKLNLVTPAGQKMQKVLEIPVSEYEQKTELLFPIRGKFVVGGGHDSNEPHKSEWSQHYAYDILGVGPNYEISKNEGKTNEDFFTWNLDVIAPAAGKVVYARNDVPDNKTPGIIDRDLFMKLPDPIRSFSGNNVVIDHGNGEFSFFAHLKMGSVAVKEGDSVQAGQTIGKLGNSGNSDAPHLHYHLMSGPTSFRNDGLPSKFKNVRLDFLTSEKINVETPKRGVYLTAE